MNTNKKTKLIKSKKELLKILENYPITEEQLLSCLNSDLVCQREYDYKDFDDYFEKEDYIEEEIIEGFSDLIKLFKKN